MHVIMRMMHQRAFGEGDDNYFLRRETTHMPLVTEDVRYRLYIAAVVYYCYNKITGNEK